jgi:hypothetical protein
MNVHSLQVAPDDVASTGTHVAPTVDPRRAAAAIMRAPPCRSTHAPVQAQPASQLNLANPGPIY